LHVGLFVERLKFAVVDIETTGRSNKVTEVAVVTVDDGKITGQWSTLVNPREFIPRNITLLTGITQEMVAVAPVFGEIASDFLDMISDRIFVAHSVAFDYGILKYQLASEGISFNTQRICTVRLSRSIFPNLSSYSLSKICQKLGIEITGRHRALGDAMATAKLLILLLQNDVNGHLETALNRQKRESTLPPALDKNHFLNLPTDTGVYRFLDSKGKVLYVGKAKNIRQRVESHFRDYEPGKSALKDVTTNIEYTRTGSELLAFLVEAHDIKFFFPEYNKAAKFASNAYGLLCYEDRNGLNRIGIAKKSGWLQLKGSFSNPLQARAYLKYLTEQHDLCPALCGLDSSSECLSGNCKCVCSGNLETEVYNKKVKSALAADWQLSGRFLFKLQGRNFKEQAFVLLEDGIYKGYGFVDKDFVFTKNSNVKPYLIPQRNYTEICRILIQHLYAENTGIEVIELKECKKQKPESLNAFGHSF
jgi:DNA polymerase-3 subunit epsilon